MGGQVVVCCFPLDAAALVVIIIIVMCFCERTFFVILSPFFHTLHIVRHITTTRVKVLEIQDLDFFLVCFIFNFETFLFLPMQVVWIHLCCICYFEILLPKARKCRMLFCCWRCALKRKEKKLTKLKIKDRENNEI